MDGRAGPTSWPRGAPIPRHHHAPGGESLAHAAARAATAVDRILADLGVRLGERSERLELQPVTGPGLRRSAAGRSRHGPRRRAAEPWSIVVAHDGILRLVLMQLLDVSIDHYWSLPFGLCSVTVVELRGGRARLRAHNLADHLDR